MFDAPQANGEEAHKDHPILLDRKRFLGRTESLDLDVAFSIRRSGRLVRYEKEPPNQDDRDSGDW